jgi:hypothetical protein
MSAVLEKAFIEKAAKWLAKDYTAPSLPWLDASANELTGPANWFTHGSAASLAEGLLASRQFANSVVPEFERLLVRASVLGVSQNSPGTGLLTSLQLGTWNGPIVRPMGFFLLGCAARQHAAEWAIYRALALLIHHTKGFMGSGPMAKKFAAASVALAEGASVDDLCHLLEGTPVAPSFQALDIEVAFVGRLEQALLVRKSPSKADDLALAVFWLWFPDFRLGRALRYREDTAALERRVYASLAKMMGPVVYRDDLEQRLRVYVDTHGPPLWKPIGAWAESASSTRVV